MKDKRILARIKFESSVVSLRYLVANDHEERAITPCLIWMAGAITGVRSNAIILGWWSFAVGVFWTRKSNDQAKGDSGNLRRHS